MLIFLGCNKLISRASLFFRSHACSCFLIFHLLLLLLLLTFLDLYLFFAFLFSPIYHIPSFFVLSLYLLPPFFHSFDGSIPLSLPLPWFFLLSFDTAFLRSFLYSFPLCLPLTSLSHFFVFTPSFFPPPLLFSLPSFPFHIPSV